MARLLSDNISSGSNNVGNSEQLVKIVIEQINGSLANFDKSMKEFTRTAQSAMNPYTYFSTELKNLNTKTGQGTLNIYAQQSEAQNIMNALQYKLAYLNEKASTGAEYRIASSAINYGTGNITLHGKKAQTRAMAEVAEVAGGMLIPAPTKANPDRFTFLLPLPDDITSEDKEWIKGRSKAVFAGSSELSRKEAKSRKQKEQEKIDIEVAKYFEEEAKEEERARQKKLEEKEKRRKKETEFEQNWLDVEAEGEYESWEKMDKEAGRNMSNEKRRISESARRDTAIFKSMLAVVTVIADITRRILTATIKNAVKADREAVESHDVGVSLLERRGMDIFDIAKGLPAGSTFGAVSALQNMFGDVTRLDEGALAILARVMGGDVADLVRSGMGGKEPDKLLDNILDAYFSQFKAGKNSLGQTVGQEQARRELVSSLKAVSPEIAVLFSRMAEDYMRGGTFENAKGWRNEINVNKAGVMGFELDFSAEAGQRLNEIKATFEDIKTTMLTRLAVPLDAISRKVETINFGKTAQTIEKQDLENKKTNETNKQYLKQEKNKAVANVDAFIESKAKGEALTRLQASTGSFTSGRDDWLFDYDTYVALFDPDNPLLTQITFGRKDNPKVVENFMKAHNIQSPAHIKEYIETLAEAYRVAFYNPEVIDDLKRIEVIDKRIEKIDEANANQVGSGDIQDVSMSSALLESLVYDELLDDNLFNNMVQGSYANKTEAQKDIIRQGFKNYITANYKGTTNKKGVTSYKVKLPGAKKSFTVKVNTDGSIDEKDMENLFALEAGNSALFSSWRDSASLTMLHAEWERAITKSLSASYMRDLLLPYENQYNKGTYSITPNAFGSYDLNINLYKDDQLVKTITQDITNGSMQGEGTLDVTSQGVMFNAK